MKRVIKLLPFFIVAFLVSYKIQAQAPPKFNYQAVARDAVGKFIINKTVGIKVEILNTATSSVVYTETQTAGTNEYGLFSLKIGGGAGFSAIDWGAGAYSVRISIDPAGGSTFISIGTAELLSVPFALYANAAKSTSGGTIGSNKTLKGGYSITIDSISKPGSYIFNSTLDTSRFVSIVKPANGSKVKIIAWDGNNWSLADAPTGLSPLSDTDTTNDLTIKTVFNGAVTGTYQNLKINRILLDSINIGSQKDNYILKVKNGILTFVADTAKGAFSIRTSKSLDYNKDTIGLKPGSKGVNVNEVLTWDGFSWKPKVFATGTGYTIGNGLSLKSGVLEADSLSSIWNANRLMGILIDTTGGIIPGSTLVYKGGSFVPSTITGTTGNPSSFDNITLDTVAGKTYIGVVKGSLDSGYIAPGYHKNTLLSTDKNGKVVWLSTDSLVSGGTSDWSSVVGKGLYYNGGNVAIGSNSISTVYKLEVTGRSSMDDLSIGGPLNAQRIQTDTLFFKAGVGISGKVLTALDDLGNVGWVSSGWSLSGNDILSKPSSFIGTTSKNALKFRTGNTQRMVIDSITGNTTIGDNAKPTNLKLSVSGGLNVDNEGTYSSAGAFHTAFKNRLVFGPDTSGEGISSNRPLDSYNRYGLDFSTKFFTRLQITQGGLIGIGDFYENGANYPSHVFTVGTNTSFTQKYNVRFIQYGGKGNRGLYVDDSGVIRDTTMIGSIPTGNQVWALNGNVLTPVDFLGTKSITDTNSIRFKTQGLLRASIDKDGKMGIGGKSISTATLAVYGNMITGNLSAPSDIRYKKNVSQIGNALETVNKLTGVSYNWRRDEFPDMKFMEGKDLGLIAQEVEKVLPELVMTDNNGFKTVRYTQLIPVLLEAIKEQQKQIESLKAEVSLKDGKVQNSENRIQSLESSMKTLNSQMQLMLELVGSNEGVKAGK